MKVAVVILNWNGKKDTIECLESINKSLEYRVQSIEKRSSKAQKLQNSKIPKLQTPNSKPKVEVVVVDNGSTDGSVEMIKKMVNGQWSMINKKRRNQPSTINHQPLAVRLIENKENLGFAEGNNVGIRFALKNGADFVFLLNNDTLVDKNLVNNLLQVAKEKNAGILGPKIYFAEGFEFHKNRYKEKDLGKVIWFAGGVIDWANVFGAHRGVDEVDRGQYNKIEETDFASGCCMLVRREVFEKIGFFDKRYFLYLEDLDFCLRAKKAGFKILFVPKAVLWHKVGKSAGIGSSLCDYFITRNRMLFGMKYARRRTKFNLIEESIRLLITGRPWQKRAVKDFYFKNFGQGSWHE